MFLSRENLHFVISDKRRISEDIARTIFAQLADAVNHFHQKHIVHLDIKVKILINLVYNLARHTLCLLNLMMIA